MAWATIRRAVFKNIHGCTESLVIAGRAMILPPAVVVMAVSCVQIVRERGDSVTLLTGQRVVLREFDVGKDWFW